MSLLQTILATVQIMNLLSVTLQLVVLILMIPNHRGLQICKPTWNIWIQIHGWSSFIGVAMPGHVQASAWVKKFTLKLNGMLLHKAVRATFSVVWLSSALRRVYSSRLVLQATSVSWLQH